MKNIKKIFSILAVLFFVTEIVALPVLAAEMEYYGLEVNIETDKETYDIGEQINAVITVKNTNSEVVRIANLEHLIPEGYKLSKDSVASTTDVELQPGESVTLDVTYGEETVSSEENQSDDFFDKIIFGETWGIPNILLVLIAAVAVFLFFHFT